MSQYRNMVKPKWETLTFSGMQRYVMICECVFGSDEHLSQADRCALIQDLLESNEKHTTESIAALCKEKATTMLETNMVNARIRNDYHRGY